MFLKCLILYVCKISSVNNYSLSFVLSSVNNMDECYFAVFGVDNIKLKIKFRYYDKQITYGSVHLCVGLSRA